MSHDNSLISIKAEKTLVEKLDLERYSDNSIEFWSIIYMSRHDLLIGKSNLLSLIHTKVSLGEATPRQAAQIVSAVLGLDDPDVVFELVEEFEGPDPKRHLWYVDENGYCCTHD